MGAAPVPLDTRDNTQVSASINVLFLLLLSCYQLQKLAILSLVPLLHIVVIFKVGLFFVVVCLDLSAFYGERG